MPRFIKKAKTLQPPHQGRYIFALCVGAVGIGLIFGEVINLSGTKSPYALPVAAGESGLWGFLYAKWILRKLDKQLLKYIRQLYPNFPKLSTTDSR